MPRRLDNPLGVGRWVNPEIQHSKFKSPLRVARVLGLAPFVLQHGRIAVSRYLFWYSIVLNLSALAGTAIYIYYYKFMNAEDHGSWALSSVVERSSAITIVVASIMNAVFLVRRQVPQLLKLLQHSRVHSDVLAEPTKSALYIFRVDALRCSLCIAVVGFAILSKFDVYIIVSYSLYQLQGLISSAELSLFVYLIDSLSNYYVQLHEKLNSIKSDKIIGKNIASKVVLIRRSHKNITDLIGRMCVCFGPQVASLIISRCMDIVTLTYELGIGVGRLLALRSLNPDASQFAVYLTWAVISILFIPVYIISLILTMNAAHRVIERASATLTDTHDLLNVNPLTEQETEQLELLSAQISQRPIQVSLGGLMTLDLSVLLGAVSALVNYIILILQLRNVKLDVTYETPEENATECTC